MVFAQAVRRLFGFSRIFSRSGIRTFNPVLGRPGSQNVSQKACVCSCPRGISVEPSSYWRKTGASASSRFGALLLAFGAYSVSWYFFSAKIKADASVEVSPQLKEEEEEIEEPITSVRFPKWLEVLQDGVLTKQRLLGAGPRFMTPLRVKVYSVGVYINEKEARSALSGFEYSNLEQLEGDDKFWSSFSIPRSDSREGRRAFGKTFRLVCIREVAGKHMQNGFDRGLLKRVREAERKMNMPDGKQALKKFNSFFLEKVSMGVGCELLFVCSPHGTVDTWIDGVHYGQVKNDALCWALCDMFLGMKPVSKEIKQQVSNGCFSWLQSS